MRLVSKIKEFFSKYREPRYRDRRAWYASDLTKNMRDLYWGATGERETNPTDLKGEIRMLLGKIIEDGIDKYILSNLHFFGIHAFAGSQVTIGGSDPHVDGKLDKMMVERIGDKFEKPWVLEIKTKYGKGADFFKNTMDPGTNYLAQLGYYLRDLNKKGVTNQGMFLFVLVSDMNFAEFVQILCRYDESKDEIIAYEAETMLDGRGTQVIDYRLKLGPVIERLKVLEKHVAEKTLPPAEHKYKFPVTIELIDAQSDSTIRTVLDGAKVLGDWEISYSRYKNKHVELEKTQLGYTQAELKLFEEVYLARHPRSKKRAS